MLTFLDSLIGSLAPHQCLGCGAEGKILCGPCTALLPDTIPKCYHCQLFSARGATCKTCKKHTPLRSVHSITDYEGVAESVVRRLKFERAIAAANVIAGSMAATVTLPVSSLLVPVPTAQQRIRQRGYDQSLVIAQELATRTGLPVQKLLVRHGNLRQTGSTRKERLRQLEHAFTVRTPKTTWNGPVILIDDVMTTGATLEAAARALWDQGYKDIQALTFARA